MYINTHNLRALTAIVSLFLNIMEKNYIMTLCEYEKESW